MDILTIGILIGIGIGVVLGVAVAGTIFVYHTKRRQNAARAKKLAEAYAQTKAEREAARLGP